MAKFEDMFGATPYQVGPMSPAVLDEMERQKNRKKLAEVLNKKRQEKVLKYNEDKDDLIPRELPKQTITQSRGMPQIQPQDQSQPQDMVPELPSYTDMMPEGAVDRQLNGSMGYGLREPQGSELNLDVGISKEPEVPQMPFKGTLPRNQDKPNSRQMLYDYLTNRRKSEPAFQEQYKELSGDAETGRVLNTFASGLGEMASMAGTLGGKRSDTGDMKALPNAIYGAMRKQSDETMGLRRLENQEQVSDIKMLRDLEKGDLDNLRTQKILSDLYKQRNVPKTTQFYNEGDPENGIPPSTMVIDSDGKFKEQTLPMGTKSMANAYTLGQPLYTPEGKTIIPQVSRAGTIRYPEAPGMPAEGVRLKNQAEADKADLRLREIESERKTANDKEKQKLDREELNLKKAKDAWERNRDQQKIDLDESKSNNPKPGKDVAGETLDRTFAKDYEQYITMGGKSGLMQKLATLKNARDKLEKINPPPRAAGAFGEAGMDFFAPEYAEIMSNVRGAIQETLRQTLGSQFTEREGEQILSRSFNPRQTKEANLRNLDREIQNIVGRAKAKQKAVDYFEKNSSMRGFQSGSGAGGGAPKKQHNFKLNKTRFVYPDGRFEEKEGIL